MLSSIHPLGERARANRWGITVTAHVVGSTVGGALSGALLGGLGALLAHAGAGRGARVAVALAIALFAVAVDAGRGPRWARTPRRQVDERWLTAYRGWVYGAGYGVQLGMGGVTIVTAATVYALGAVAIASGSLPAGALIGAAFGLARGLTVLAARSVHTPEELMAFHRALASRRPVGVLSALAGDVAIVVGAGLLTFGVVG
jgi:hypothetical protein